MDENIVQRLCHMLGSCEADTRSSALRSLSKLFRQCKGQADELSMLKVCKALYYMIWMTDKPVKVRQIAVTVLELYKGFNSRANKILFFTCMFRSISMEWASLDKNRVDKMLLFVRIAVAALLELLNDENWNIDALRDFENIVVDKLGVFNKRSLGFAFQFLQTFMDEMKENIEDLSSKNELKKLDERAYLHLMAPFLWLGSTLDNKQLLNTLSMYVLKRVATLPGVPHHGVARALERLSGNKHIKSYGRKVLMQALKECGNTTKLDDAVEKEVEAVISHIEAKMQAQLSQPSHEAATSDGQDAMMDTDDAIPESRSEKSVKVELNADNSEEASMAPELVDVSEELKNGMYEPNMEDHDCEDYINLADVLASNPKNARLGKHLREISTLNAMRKYLIATGQTNDKLMKRLNRPRMQRQFALLSLHNIRRLRLIRKFKCARKLHRIMTITESAANMPTRRRSIDIAKALHNIKHAKPGHSIVRKRNRKPNETKHVVFNLKNNQVATIPKKKKSTLTMPMWY
ncbi:nucleolar protein,Nop52 family protein [Babesia divergens]|uniref:Nucleolar protein,Nop52 family protein n=1 Tax=Babesia divergens TaxID=32595 RepID=A0AAD9G7V8_BABDI|nr:nucleolar protein,Nop52 family protein [Babesia divergens]